MNKRWLIACFLLISGCVSYYDDYDRNGYHGGYVSPAYHYSYNAPVYSYDGSSPIGLRGLTVNDFYMLDNHPGDYFDMQLWGGVSQLSHFAIHNLVRYMAP